MNQSHENIVIYTTQASKIIYKQDTISTLKNNRVRLTVERQKEALKIVISNDSLSKTVAIPSKNSPEYNLNILCNYGIGMLVDRKNPKRYAFPKRVYINASDTLNQYFKYRQLSNKGALYLHFSLPHINSFHLTPENEGAKVNTGFWGFTVGLDYYHAEKQFLNIGVSGVSDFFVPLPAAVDLSGEYELMRSRYISISNNHSIKRFKLGYGLSYARNTWEFIFYDRFDPPPPTREPVKKSAFAFGLIFPTYFRLGERFNIGLVYRPTFYRPNSTINFRYEHLISVDFAWKVRLAQIKD
jgi:hypothetical protein